jgi:hypothetical protein
MVLDYYARTDGEWPRIGVALDVPADNRSASGVPE